MSGQDSTPRAVGPACHDCGALPGEAHEDGCDVARCLWTGMQRLSCSEFGWTDPPEGEPGPAHDCGQDVWTGTWPGEADCIRLGWYSKFTPSGWVQCGPDDPEAGPNLNRLAIDARWDRETHRWELRS